MSLLPPIPLFAPHPLSPARRLPLLKPSLCRSSPTPVPQPAPAPPQGPEAAPAAAPLNGGCKACGREEVERGCDGDGRIQGGIATFPGFGWWPIKAYRPCPGFVASGGRYRRRGQSMDEVASGGRRLVSKVVATSEAQSSEE